MDKGMPVQVTRTQPARHLKELIRQYDAGLRGPRENANLAYMSMWPHLNKDTSFTDIFEGYEMLYPSGEEKTDTGGMKPVVIAPAGKS